MQRQSYSRSRRPSTKQVDQTVPAFGDFAVLPPRGEFSDWKVYDRRDGLTVGKFETREEAVTEARSCDYDRRHSGAGNWYTDEAAKEKQLRQERRDRPQYRVREPEDPGCGCQIDAEEQWRQQQRFLCMDVRELQIMEAAASRF